MSTERIILPPHIRAMHTHYNVEDSPPIQTSGDSLTDKHKIILLSNSSRIIAEIGKGIKNVYTPYKDNKKLETIRKQYRSKKHSRITTPTKDYFDTVERMSNTLLQECSEVKWQTIDPYLSSPISDPNTFSPQNAYQQLETAIGAAPTPRISLFSSHVPEFLEPGIETGIYVEREIFFTIPHVYAVHGKAALIGEIEERYEHSLPLSMELATINKPECKNALIGLRGKPLHPQGFDPNYFQFSSDGIELIVPINDIVRNLLGPNIYTEKPAICPAGVATAVIIGSDYPEHKDEYAYINVINGIREIFYQELRYISKR